MVGYFCPILQAFDGSEAVRQIVFGTSTGLDHGDN